MRLFEVFSFSLSTITRSRGQPAAGESWVVRHEFTWKVGKNLKWIEKNSQKQPSNIYWMIIIVNHLLIWLFSQASSGCHLVESAANGEYYFVSLLKLAIFRDQGHIREVVAVRDASHRNLSTIPIPPPRQAFVLSTKFFSRPPPCLYTCSSIWPS